MPDPIAWSLTWPYFLAALAGGYLLGSVPFGLVITKLAGLGDIRQIGSGNIGATNVLRTGRKDLALLTLIGDSGKGAAAVGIGWLWGDYTALFAGIGAFLGHLYPLYLKFRGGKGVATTLGILLAYAWPVGLGASAVWLITAAITRISSLSALLAVLLAPALALWVTGGEAVPENWLVRLDHPVVVLPLVIAPLVWWKHRANIARLIRGEEPRIGGKQES